MKVLGRVLAVLACVVLAAHFLRAGLLVPMAVALALPCLLLVRERWGVLVLRVALALATLEWARTAFLIARERQAAGRPWLRAGVIFGAVGLVTALAALLVRGRERERS